MASPMDRCVSVNGWRQSLQWIESLCPMDGEQGALPNRSEQVLVHFGTIPFSPSLQSVLIFGPNITDLCTKHPRSLAQTSLMNLPQEQSLVKEAWGSRLINQPIRTLISAASPKPSKTDISPKQQTKRHKHAHRMGSVPANPVPTPPFEPLPVSFRPPYSLSSLGHWSKTLVPMV